MATSTNLKITVHSWVSICRIPKSWRRLIQRRFLALCRHKQDQNMNIVSLSLKTGPTGQLQRFQLLVEQIIFISQEILKKIYKNSEIRFSTLWESTKKIHSEPGKITSKTSINTLNISTHSSLGLSIIKEKILI